MSTLRPFLLKSLLLWFLVALSPKLGATEAIVQLKRELANTPKKEKKKRITIYNDLGWEYSFIDSDSALYFVRQGMLIANEDPTQFRVELANSYGTLGIIYDVKGKNDIALSYYHKSLDLKEKLGDLLGVANAKSNIGALFMTQEEYAKALVYFNEAIEIEKGQKDTIGQIGSLLNVAIIQKNLNRRPQAKITLKKALDLSLRIKDDYYMASIYINLGTQYLEENELDSALYYLENSLPYNEKFGQISAKAIALDNISNVYLQQGKLNLALLRSEEALEFSKQVGNYTTISKVFETRYEIYMLLGDLDNAYQNKFMFTQMKDSLLNMGNKQIVDEIEAKYQLAKKQKLLLKQDLQIKADQKEGEFYLLIIIFVSALVLLLAWVVFNKIRNNRVLANKNDVIENALEEKEILMREIHHRVKNNIQAIKSIINIQRRKTNSEETKQSLSETINRVNAMSLIHEKLYLQNGLRNISCSIYLEELTNEVFKSFGINDSNCQIELKLVDHFFETDDLLTLGLIFNELITNACKYSQNSANNRNISIRSHLNDAVFQLEISNHPNTENSVSEEGFGKELIAALVYKLGGKVTYSAGNTFETTVEIPIP